MTAAHLLNTGGTGQHRAILAPTLTLTATPGENDDVLPTGTTDAADGP